jgi:hypothetical protein
MRKRQVDRATPYQLIVAPSSAPPLFWRSFGVGALLALALLALLYLLHQLVDLPFLPADFFVWLLDRLPGLVRTVGFLVTTSLSVVLNVLISDALIAVGVVGLLLCFAGSGGLIGALCFRLCRAIPGKRGWIVGALGGLLWGIGLSVTSLLVNRSALAAAGSMLGWYGIPLALFILWGVATSWANARLLPLPPQSKRATQPRLTRRRFLLQLSAGALTLALASGAAGLQLARWRNQQRRTVANDPFALPDFFPSTLRARIYPTTDGAGIPLPDFQFPEFAHPRYRPETHPIGVCFSGGGPLSASAAMGQMRGLAALGLIDQIGAISAVSGGAWFSTIFNYAPVSIADATLLGEIIEPAAITVVNIQNKEEEKKSPSPRRRQAMSVER